MSPTALKNNNGSMLETALATVRLRSDGLVQVTIRSGAVATEATVRDVVQAVRTLLPEGERTGVLVDIRARHDSKSSARRYGAGPEPAQVARRIALLIESPVSRMIGQAFLLAAKPLVPTRIFTSEEDAVRWLRQV